MQPKSKPTKRKIRYWRIALGDDPAQWTAWASGNFVAMAWDELGDLSQLRRREFDQRRSVILAHFPERTKASAEQVWHFAHRIHEGDRVVVSRDNHSVLAIGTVAGPYFFVPDVYKGHCLPVEWDDLTMRRGALPNWRRALVELNAEQFAAIRNAPALETLDAPFTLREVAPPYTIQPAAHPAGEAAFENGRTHAPDRSCPPPAAHKR